MTKNFEQLRKRVTFEVVQCRKIGNIFPTTEHNLFGDRIDAILKSVNNTNQTSRVFLRLTYFVVTLNCVFEI